MKLMTLLLAFVFTMSAHAFISAAGRSTNLKYDGSVDASTVEKEFINVKNSHSATIDAGKAVILDVADDDGAGVLIATTAGQTPICVMAESCAVGKLCKCQTYGLNSSVYFNAAGGNAVAGAPFWLSTGAAGYIAKINTPGGSDVRGGVFYDAASASGQVEVFIKMR